MRTRRIVSLLLCISFALAAATGILLQPFIRFVVGISNEGMWRLVHFYCTNALLVPLIFIHILLNRKALGNYLRVARIRSIFSYTIAVIVLVGVIYFGVSGKDLGFTSLFYEEDLRRARSTPEPTLVSFPEDFEDGNANGWRLGPGWEVKLENGNHVLSGSSDRWSWARPQVSGWFNYTLESRVKLINGKFQLNFRRGEVPFRSRYILGMDENGFYLSREVNGEYPNLTGGPPFLELNEWHRLKIILNGTNIKVYLDDKLKLDYTDNDLPFIFGGFSFEVAPNSYAFFDDIDVNVAELIQMTPAPTKPAFEAKEYMNEEYGFSIKYPKEYLKKELITPGCVFKAISPARPPVPLPEVEVFIDDVEEDTTFADLKELTKAGLETSWGGTDIEFVSDKETTLADGITPAHELVVEWSVAGAPRLKTLILSVIKENKWFSIVLTDIANYWPETEAELKEVAYSLQFK